MLHKVKADFLSLKGYLKMSDITSLTLTQTLSDLKANKFSLDELNKAYLERIERFNPGLNAFLEVEKTSSKLPFAVKDIIITQGIKTTAGSKILSNFIPPYNATVIDKLLSQDLSIIGKTNCDEFAMGSSGENSAYGATKNPWNESKVPGGTSSGSAAAVASDMAVFALGTDTGGSIRQPSSLCGVVGLKPSYGRVSRYGAIAITSSTDQIGPITKSVEDARQVLEWMSGGDDHDSNAIKEPFISSKSLGDLKGVRVGVPKEYFAQGLDKDVEEVIREAISKLEELGAEIVEVSLPHTEYGIAAYYIINPSEISANLARFDGIRFGGKREEFGEEVKRRIMLGTFALSSGYYDAYFEKAARVRALIKRDFDQALEKVDCIVGPVSPTVAWNLGEKVDDPLKMYLSDAYTIPASLAGLPALSVPCGFVEGLPVGMQIIGKQFDEDTILAVGEVYEQATSWHQEKPKL
jgi:aspartyl-tRNA(Asn)/glutamyl-tRNA(Gln) amidotransferase subunit A